MKEFWPAGTEAASQVSATNNIHNFSELNIIVFSAQMLDRFLNTKARISQIGEVSPLAEGAVSSAKDSRISQYAEGRNRVDLDTSSRLRFAQFCLCILITYRTLLRSPYLTSGVISARECVRRTTTFLKVKQVKADRGSGVGMWVQEIGESICLPRL